MKVVARMARPVELRGSADYLISAELGNEIVGGRCALTVTVGSYPPKTVQFFIRGKEVREGPQFEPHRRRPALGGLPRAGRSIRTLVRGTVNSLPNFD